MTMGIGNFDYLVSQISLGSTLLTNGTFTTSGTWTLGSHWAITTGTPGYAAKTTGGSGTLSQTGLSVTTGLSYAVTFTVQSYSAGTITVSLGGNAGIITYNANGTYTAYIPCGSTNTNLVFTPAGSTDVYQITSVSLQLVSNGQATLQGTTLGIGQTGLPIIIGTTLGNARGNGAIDIQFNQTAITQVAGAPQSIVIGQQNSIASQVGTRHLVFGIGNTINSTATFSGSTNGQASILGVNNTVGGYQDVAIGVSNTINTYSGTSAGTAIGSSNTVQAQGTAIGNQCIIAQGSSGAVAVGYNSLAYGNESLAFGYTAHAVGTSSLAISGSMNSGAGVYGVFAIGIGGYSAAGNYGTAIGYNSRTGYQGLFASNTVNTTTITISGNVTDQFTNGDSVTLYYFNANGAQTSVTRTISSLSYSSPNTTFTISSVLASTGTIGNVYVTDAQNGSQGTAIGYNVLALGKGTSVFGGGGNSTNSTFSSIAGQLMIGPSMSAYQTITHSTLSYGYRTQTPQTQYHVNANNLLITDSGTLSSTQNLNNTGPTSASTDWTLGTGVTYSSNSFVVSLPSGTLSQTSANMSTATTAGYTYLLTYVISSWTAGTVQSSLGAINGQLHTAGEGTQTITDIFYNVAGSDALTFTFSAYASMTMKTFSLKQITGGNLTAIGTIAGASFTAAGSSGYTGTITTAQLTTLGTQGSMTFTGGILTAQTAAT